MLHRPRCRSLQDRRCKIVLAWLAAALFAAGCRRPISTQQVDPAGSASAAPSLPLASHLDGATNGADDPRVAWEGGFEFGMLERGPDAHGRGDYVALREEGLFVRYADLLLGWRPIDQRPYFEPSLFRQLPHVEGETWVSRDGKRVVRYHAGLLSVTDSISGDTHWSQPNAQVGGRLVHPAPGQDEVVVFSDSGQLLRWELNTGKPLPTLSFPKEWTIDRSSVPFATAGGNVLRVTLTDTKRQSFSPGFLHWPSGDPIQLSNVASPKDGGAWQDILPLKDHLLFISTRAAMRLWSTETNGFVDSLALDSAPPSKDRVDASALSPQGSLLLARNPKSRLGPEHREDASTVVELKGTADNHWSKESLALSISEFSVRELQFRRDGKFLLGWGRAGFNVWQAESGAGIFYRVMESPATRLHCVDVVGSHLALFSGHSLDTLDLASGSMKTIIAPNTEQLHCNENGVTTLSSTERSPQIGNYEASRYDWDGNQVGKRPSSRPEYLVRDWVADNAEQGKSSHEGQYRIEGDNRICLQGVCRPIVGRTHVRDGNLKLFYLLDGKMLVALSSLGVRFLSPDGQTLLGSIVLVAKQGFIYLDGPNGDIASLLHERSPRGLRGTSKLEPFNGAEPLCAIGDRLLPWARCQKRFESTGDLARMLSRVSGATP